MTIDETDKDLGESDDEIAEDVLPEAVLIPAVPLALDTLQPWHRPRKQFIRDRQWVHLSARLIGDLIGSGSLRKGPDGRFEVNYLTLPGIDYLDARLLGETCVKQDASLTCTGFLATGEHTPARARAQFREESLVKAGFISDRSTTFPYRLEDIVPPNSQSHKDFKKRSPYHIVNIDACGSIARPGANHATRMVDAIFRILEVQFSTYLGRWLLFVTVDVRKDDLAPQTLQRLNQAIFENAKDNPAFKEEAIRALSEERAEIEGAIEEAAATDGLGFIKLFALGLSKWLLHLARNKGWSLKSHYCFCYSTREDGAADPSMPCLAFEFVPPPPGLRDAFAVTNARPQQGGVVTEDLCVRTVKKVKEIVDLDVLMAADEDLRSHFRKRIRDLLEEAGYQSNALDAI